MTAQITSGNEFISVPSSGACTVGQAIDAAQAIQGFLGRPDIGKFSSHERIVMITITAYKAIIDRAVQDRKQS